MPASVAQLVRRFEAIERDHMQGLPIVNSRLAVEAVGFTGPGEHRLGVLITPWFMNLVLLPGNDDWGDREPGSVVEWALPYGTHEFTTCRDEDLGTYLTAVLFRTVVDFPDLETARMVAEEILRSVRSEPDAGAAPSNPAAVSRRSLITGRRAP